MFEEEKKMLSFMLTLKSDFMQRVYHIYNFQLRILVMMKKEKLR